MKILLIHGNIHGTYTLLNVASATLFYQGDKYKNCVFG